MENLPKKQEADKVSLSENNNTSVVYVLKMTAYEKP